MAGLGIPGCANHVETSNGSEVDDDSGGKVPVVMEWQLLGVADLSLGSPYRRASLGSLLPSTQSPCSL